MKERPIIFSSEMVKAIFEGRKTQTRRVIKPQPPKECDKLNGPEMYEPAVEDKYGDLEPGASIYGVYDEEGEYGCKCPYGKVGDRLWVREKFQFSRGDFAPTLDEELTKKPQVMYYASDTPQYRDKDKWKPSIHMPRWASRLTLEITDIRVERLQEISEKDAIGEGIRKVSNGTYKDYEFKGGNYVQPKHSFYSLWNSLHKKEHRWETDPWVWVISFKRLAEDSE